MNDVGVENPSVTGGSSGGDVASYPDYGDPLAPNTCALNDDVLPCDYVMKVARRDHFQLTLATITARIGMRSAVQTTSDHYDGSSTASDVKVTVDPKTGNVTASMTVTGGPAILDIETVGYTMSWLDLRPTQYLFLSPQK